MSAKMTKPSYIDFDNEKYKKSLEKYSLKSEVGVLSYKYSKKIHKYWKFKTPQLARESAKNIYKILTDNLNKCNQYIHMLRDDKLSINILKYFMRADICRKFIQMGYTRAMRYYYHKGGTKWLKLKDGTWIIKPLDLDPIKKQSADIFKIYLNKTNNNPRYNLFKSYFKHFYYKYQVSIDI